MAILPLVAFLSCGRAPKTFDAVQVARHDVRVLSRLPTPRAANAPSPWVALFAAQWIAQVAADAQWRSIVEFAETTRAATEAPPAQVASVVSAPPSGDAFLACTRAHESDSAGGYGAVSPSGTYRGAYQFDRSTWDSAAQLAGRADLVGADPASVEPGAQDRVALALYGARGNQPWGGRC